MLRLTMAVSERVERGNPMEGENDPGCACEVREDYDGERIRVHCKEHCPRVQRGDWEHCKGC
jgi:hypothetical protein